MNIYVAHSSEYDYIKKLYEPIKNAKGLSKHHFFFPHDEVSKEVKTKEIIKNYDLVIAEVSLPATGLGIELGWADNFIEYENTKDLIEKIEDFLSH